MDQNNRITEFVREINLDHGHMVPAVRVTCKICGKSESAEGSGSGAASRAESALRAECRHTAESGVISRNGDLYRVVYPTGWILTLEIPSNPKRPPRNLGWTR